MQHVYDRIMLGICIGYIISKTNIHVCVVGYKCSNMFQASLYDVGHDVSTSWHGSTCLVLCMFLCALYLFKETTFPYLADQATRISVQNLLYFYSQKSNNILGSNWICLEVLKDVPAS